MKNILKKLPLKKIIDSKTMFIVLSIHYPFAYLLQVNCHIYSRDQIVATLIFMTLASIILALVCKTFITVFIEVNLMIVKKMGIRFDREPVFSKYQSSFHYGVGTIIVLILFHSMIREYINISYILAPLYLLIILGMIYLAFQFNLRHLHYILCVLIIMNYFLMGLHIIRGESEKNYSQKKQSEVLFKIFPNVYFVILESYASLDQREKIYGVDNIPLTRELLSNHYDIFKTYSNYAPTIPSLASIFLMDHHYYKSLRGIGDSRYFRKIIGGIVDNNVVSIFAKNGYRIDYSEFRANLYDHAPIVNAKGCQPLLQPIEVLDGFFVLSNKMLHYSLWETKLFQTWLWFPDNILEKLMTPVKNDKEEDSNRPVFKVMYKGARHSPNSFSKYPPEIQKLPGARQMPLWQLNRVNDYWITAYKRMVEKEDSLLIEFIRELVKEDPDAMVIFQGDHGPLLNNGSWIGNSNDLNGSMLQNGISPAEVTRDFFEVFLAIKWPDRVPKTSKYFSPVNLFRHVFAELANNDSIIQSSVKDDSFWSGNKDKLFSNSPIPHRTVKDGRVLSRWEPISFPNE